MLARDLYSYLHLPMVAGIVLFALGMKTTLAHVDEALEIIPAVGLSGGLALYFAAHVASRLRIGGGWGHGRWMATLVLLALIPVATVVPALAALALVSRGLRRAHRLRGAALPICALLDSEPPRRVHDGGGSADRGAGPEPARLRPTQTDRSGLREHLAQLGREGVRLAGPAVLATEEAAVVAREDHRLLPEPLGDRMAAAVRHLTLRLGPGGA